MLFRTLAFASVFVAGVAYAGGNEHDMHHMKAPSEKKMCHSSKAHKAKEEGASAAYERAMRRMHEAMDITYSGDADVDFARGMIPHHQGAVDMALVQQQYGKDEELKAFTRRVIEVQNAEIGMMSQWENTHGGNFQYKDAATLSSVVAYKAAMKDMHHAMMVEYTGDADVDFARGMIPHHQGAIDMAAVHLLWGDDAMLRKISQDIIRSQGQEIRYLKEWLAKHPVAEHPQPKKNKKKAKQKKVNHDQHAHH